MIDNFIKILKKELMSLNSSQSLLYNHNWWSEEDMDNFLAHVKKQCCLSTHNDNTAVICPKCKECFSITECLSSTTSEDDIIKKAQKFSGLINNVDDMFDHMRRLQECTICKKDYYDKRCPDCLSTKKENDNSRVVGYGIYGPIDDVDQPLSELRPKHEKSNENEDNKGDSVAQSKGCGLTFSTEEHDELICGEEIEFYEDNDCTQSVFTTVYCDKCESQNESEFRDYRREWVAGHYTTVDLNGRKVRKWVEGYWKKIKIKKNVPQDNKSEEDTILTELQENVNKEKDCIISVNKGEDMSVAGNDNIKLYAHGFDSGYDKCQQDLKSEEEEIEYPHLRNYLLGKDPDKMSNNELESEIKEHSEGITEECRKAQQEGKDESKNNN